MLLRIINVVVDSDAKRGVGILCRRGNQDAFRTCLADVQLGLVASGEKPSRFQDNIDGQLTPREVSGVALLENLNLVGADDDVLLVVADFAVEFAVNRVPLEQMGESFG